MINDQYSPEEQIIIDQIQATPRLELGSAAREAIRGRMLDEFRVVSQASIASAAAQTRLVFLTIAAVVVVTIIVIIAIIISNQNNTEPQATATQIMLSASPETATMPGTLSVSETPAPPSTLESVSSVAVTESTTPSVTGTPSVIIVIEGPVINIANNIITIYDFDIEVKANHPILNLIEIGDVVRIEGAYGSGGVVVATVVSNLSSVALVGGATVSLDGPVESINGNIIVVNGISVQLGANDPLLQTVQVGQFVSVQGNFQSSGPNIVLVVVTIVINTNVTVTDNNCWYHESGMSGMGHWHCDGSGMGMGMGDAGMGMGMGNG